jgi:microcystin-dependent protein
MPRQKAKAIFDAGVQLPAGASAGAALISDASGNGSWGTPQQLVYDSDQVGTVKAWAGSTIPTNWMLCDGRALSRGSYPDLFAAIGVTYGAGDGSTTFNIPDLLSRMVVGAGAGSGLTNRAAGAKGGKETHALVTAELAAHAHASAAHSHDLGAAGSSVPALGAWALVNATYGSGANTNDWPMRQSSGPGFQNVTDTGSTTPGNTGNAGSGTAHENMPPWCAVAYIIKATGVQLDAGGALVGATGAQGPAGPQGPQGDVGPQGPQGSGVVDQAALDLVPPRMWAFRMVSGEAAAAPGNAIRIAQQNNNQYADTDYFQGWQAGRATDIVAQKTGWVRFDATLYAISVTANAQSEAGFFVDGGQIYGNRLVPGGTLTSHSFSGVRYISAGQALGYRMVSNGSIYQGTDGRYTFGSFEYLGP